MLLSLNKFLFSVSFALDLAEKEISCSSEIHSKRVAFISLKIAEIFNLDPKERFDLCSYSLLHDNGLIETYIDYLEVSKEKSNSSFYKTKDYKNHCIIGEKNIKTFPFLTSHKDIILYHHEHWDGTGYFKKKGNEIPLLSQIISFADLLDTTFDLSNIIYNTKSDIDDFLKQHINKLFSQDMYNAYEILSNSFIFWGDLEFFDTSTSLNSLIPEYNMDVSLSEFLEITKIFSKIIDSKSKFTAKHSSDLEDKALTLVNYFNLDEDKKLKIQIAANLHDIGKLATPRHILDKEGSLTKEEFFEIKKHAYLTHHILSKLDGFYEISKWASAHHEKPDGSGYPFGLNCEELGFEERMISCLDFYQALVEDRPYRKSMSHEDAIVILKTHLNEFDIDKEIVLAIENVF